MRRLGAAAARSNEAESAPLVLLLISSSPALLFSLSARPFCPLLYPKTSFLRSVASIVLFFGTIHVNHGKLIFLKRSGHWEPLIV